MLYDLSNILDRERFKRRCNALATKGGIVELTEKTQRSTSQNRYLHLLLGYLAMEYGIDKSEEIPDPLSYVKEVIYKRLANPDIFIRRSEEKEYGLIEWTRSSADLSKEEMTLSIERLRDWSSKEGIYLPSANEQGFLAMIEVELSKMERFL